MKSRRNRYNKRKSARASRRKHRFFTRKTRIRRTRQRGGGFAYIPPPTAIVPFRRMEETDMADAPVMITYEEAKKLKENL
jgi:hypothetical protein